MDWLIGKSRKNKDVASNENNKLYLRQDFVSDRLIDGDLMPLVTLPNRVDFNEWLASNTISFFDHINTISGCLTEFCRSTTCTTMSGPGNVQYLWVDDRGKKYKCSAPQYVDNVMSFTQRCISDEAVFPTKYGNAFPTSFEKTVRKIHRLLLHIVAHIYHSHCRDVMTLNLRSHLNTITFHFLLFNRCYGLIENKELNVLGDLYEQFLCRPRYEAISQNVAAPSRECRNSTSALTHPKSNPKHSGIRPLSFKENEQKGFVRDSITVSVT